MLMHEKPCLIPIMTLIFQLLLGNRSGHIRLFDVKEMKSFYEAAGDISYPRLVPYFAVAIKL